MKCVDKEAVRLVRNALIRGKDVTENLYQVAYGIGVPKKTRFAAKMLLMMDEAIEEDGGPGSGNFGHAGRQNRIGGSAKSSVSVHENEKGDIEYEMPHIPIKVNGPQSSKSFIADYVKKNPEIIDIPINTCILS